nr:helix-turn-helix transcriptional regulator [Rhizobium laguerreae]
MLRVARELLGMSQEELAKELNLTSRAVQRVEAESPSSSLNRQDAFTEHFRGKGLMFLLPDDRRVGWGVIECFDNSELETPARFLRAARIALNQSQATLGNNADLGVMTVRRIESGNANVEGETRQFLVEFLNREGVEFISPEGGLGWGAVFAGITDLPGPRHPRASVQIRKRARSGE